EHGGHALAFHRRRLLDLGDVGELLEDAVDDAAALLDVLQLAAAEQDVDEDLVLVLQKPPRLVDLGVDVVLAGLGPDADLLDLLLVDLGLGPLARLLVAELAVVEDLADGRPLLRRHLDEVQVGLAGHLQRLRGRHHAELLAVGPDQAHRTDPDLLVDPLAAVLLMRMTFVRRRNTRFSFSTSGTTGSPGRSTVGVTGRGGTTREASRRPAVGCAPWFSSIPSPRCQVEGHEGAQVVHPQSPHNLTRDNRPGKSFLPRQGKNPGAKSKRPRTSYPDRVHGGGIAKCKRQST